MFEGGDNDPVFLKSDANFFVTDLDEFSIEAWEARKTLPGQATYPKPSESRADKVFCQVAPGGQTNE